jgi:hypothetical protein
LASYREVFALNIPPVVHWWSTLVTCAIDGQSCPWKRHMSTFRNKTKLLLFLFTFYNFAKKSRDSSVGIATGYGLTIGVLGFDSRRGLGIFLITTTSRTVMVPTQPPIQWVPGAVSLGVKRPGREADRSPPSSSEIKNAWNYTSTPPILLHGVLLS